MVKPGVEATVKLGGTGKKPGGKKLKKVVKVKKKIKKLCFNVMGISNVGIFHFKKFDQPVF